MQFRFTAICRDWDENGEYRHIVRRPVCVNFPDGNGGMRIFGFPNRTASFTAKANAMSRRAPATNPGWDSFDSRGIG